MQFKSRARSAAHSPTCTSHKIVHRDLKPQNIRICNDGSLRIAFRKTGAPVITLPPGVPSHVFLLRLHLDVYRCVLGAKQDPNEFF